MGFEADQAGRWVRAGVACAGAVAVGCVACLDVDGDTRVKAAIRAFDDVEKPGLASHASVLGPGRHGYAGWSRRAAPASKSPGRGRGRWH